MSEFVELVADVPLNLSWRRDGYVVEVVADRAHGIAHPAGEPFRVPAAVVDSFLSYFGPRPGDASISTGGWGGLIPGLRRV